MRRPETWRTTTLWETLNSREDEEAAKSKLTIATILPEVETILAKGNSSPATYTLHDEEHSFRVAELIGALAADLLPELSSYELTLLLLAAYLHDIGMTPPAGKVASHFSYLLSGDPADLSEGQRAELQVFLDDHWDGLLPPLSEDEASAEDVAAAGMITAAYVREQHNNWGAEWIREHLAAHDDDLYAGWLDDLILLCASHHFGIDKLRHSDFNPRLVDVGDCICHLRFCACLLRVADVLDFDPERTPKVLFAHREVEDGSIIHWHKSHGIGFSLDGNEVTVHAQPSDAITHHAVVCTVEDVERELLLCDRLDQETQFRRMQGWAEDLPHRWRLRTHVQRQINPRGDRYEYVNATFRPDPRRVLDLIGGVELYGEALVSVRELLQNAFDAVREQIARERLEQPRPADQETLDRLAANHQVSLQLQKDESSIRLICRDSGSGMTKDILLSRFLVGGKTANHETRDLERRCRELGFSVGRTARFGIGVLSYFLLAKRLEVATRRSIEAGDTEGTGWSFSSNGLEDFGEVSKDDACRQGTTVTLTLKPAAYDAGYEAFAEELREYLAETVRRAPCTFQFQADDTAVVPIEFGPGWSNRDAEVRRLFLSELGGSTTEHLNTPVEFLSTEDQEGIAKQDAYWEELRDRAGAAMRVVSTDGELPEGLGTYRIFTAYFELDGLRSLSFFDPHSQEGERLRIKPLGTNDVYVGPFDAQTSWNGMEVESEFENPSSKVDRSEPVNSIVELDWTSDAVGQLAVDRNSLRLSEKGAEALWQVIDRAEELLRDAAKEAEESPLTLLNLRLASAKVSRDDLSNLHWLFLDEELRELRPIPLPVRDFDTYTVNDMENDFLLEGKTVTPIRSASVKGVQSRRFSWHGGEFLPTRLAFTRTPRVRPVAIWDRARRAEQTESVPRSRAVEFPESLAQVTGLSSNMTILWNRNHPVLRALSTEGWAWATEAGGSSEDPLSYKQEAADSPAKSAAWIVYHLWTSKHQLWKGLIDRDPDFLPSLWRAIDGLEEEESVLFYKEQFNERHLWSVSATSWESSSIEATVRWLEEATRGLDDSWWLERRDRDPQPLP